MRVFASSAMEFVGGLLAKARLIFVFMIAAVAVLIWTDMITRGMWG